MLGDFLGGHALEELEAVVLVKFHQHVGGGFLVEQFVEEFSLVEVEFLV